MVTLSGKYVETYNPFNTIQAVFDSMFTIISLFPLLLVDFLDGSQLLFEFHPPVLEPDFYLSLSQTEGVSNLNATSASQVVVEVELLLQLQGLEPGVRLTTSSPWTAVGTFDN